MAKKHRNVRGICVYVVEIDFSPKAKSQWWFLRLVVVVEEVEVEGCIFRLASEGSLSLSVAEKKT
jgi:hypothetical protein